jgi:hypothetical protein
MRASPMRPGVQYFCSKLIARIFTWEKLKRARAKRLPLAGLSFTFSNTNYSLDAIITTLESATAAFYFPPRSERPRIKILRYHIRAGNLLYINLFVFDFRSTIKNSDFIHFTWNYEKMFYSYTARTKSCQIFIEFQPVTMYIYKLKVTSVNCKNNKILANFSFLTFLFNFELLPSLQILEMRILTYPKPQYTSLASFLSSSRPQMAPESQTKLHRFRDFS